MRVGHPVVTRGDRFPQVAGRAVASRRAPSAHEPEETMPDRRTAARRLWLAAPAVAGALAACRHGGGPRPALPAAGGGDSVQVAYGTQARRDVTGAIATVDGATARQATATSMADMLEGRVPGLEVRRLGGNRISLRIRGQRSFLASGEPLLVVDGTPVDGAAGGTLADMDPRTVGRVEVLRDAGSLAAYGSRGANGVLLVTTRRR
jgi:TonB-dependent SusC/RagA subfamily outer membrane receptor